MNYADELTLFTGGALPALFADAGEGVSSPHAGPTVGARIGGTGAVLGFRGRSTKHRHEVNSSNNGNNQLRSKHTNKNDNL